MPDVGSHTMSGLLKASLALHGERKESRGRVFRVAALGRYAVSRKSPNEMRENEKNERQALLPMR